MTSKELQEQLERERMAHREALEQVSIQKKELEVLRAKVAQEAKRTATLENANDTFTSLLADLQHGIFVLDEQDKIVLGNDAFYKQFEIKIDPRALTGADGTMVMGQIKYLFKEPERFAASIAQMLKDRMQSASAELALTNGLVCACYHIPIISQGVFKGHILRFADVTRAKTISDTFETQQQFYEQILSNIPADIVVFDAEKRYLYINPKAVSKPDLRKWMIGRTQQEYCAYTKKPVKMIANREQMIDTVLATKDKIEWEEAMVTPQGETIHHLRILYPVVNKEGNVELVIGYGVNITERKKIEEQILRSEEKYSGIIENMNLGMVEIDADERIIYANQRFCKMSGYKLDELISKKATDLFLQGAILKRTRSGLSKQQYGITNSFELAVRTKGGDAQWWLSSATPAFHADGSYKGTISIHLDITEKKKLEEQLKVAKQDSERSLRSKDIFLTNMSHEIRTPLNAIMGLGKLLSKSELDAQQKSYLNGIEHASSSLLGIVNDLLDISKIEAGKITIEHISFSLGTVIQQAVNVLEHNAEEKGLALTHETDIRIAPVLIGDPFRLNQVFMNMISNAIKFTDKGSIRLRATLVEEADKVQQVRVVIEDTGVGIKEEYLNTIFDKFTQEDETVVRKFGGTGLGMSITKQLMELMGGTIAVESKKNIGTTITLTFRFRIGNARVFEKKRTIRNDTFNINGKKILLVEDNSLNRLLAYTILAEYGAIVSEAENGAEAVDAMRKETFDIVLMDIQMPVMDGIQATQIIRSEINSTIPILALTANAIKSHEHKFFDAGMNDLIFKPYNELNLVNPIAKWLNKNAPVPVDKEAVIQEVTQEAVPDKDTDAKLYDISKMMSIGRGDTEFINRMLQLFVDETPPAIAKIKEGYKTGDLEPVRYYAHRLKPSITNLGIDSLKEDILKLELIKDNDPDLGRLVDKLDEVICAVIDDMQRQHLNKGK